MPDKRTKDQLSVPVSITAVIYGTVTILIVLLPTNADEFQYRTVIWGGMIVSISAFMTYFLKEIVQREADEMETLGIFGYLKELTHSLPVLVFPIAAMVVSIFGLAIGISANTVITTLFVLGIAVISIAAFTSSYFLHKSIPRATIRVVSWTLIALMLLWVKKLT